MNAHTYRALMRNVATWQKDAVGIEYAKKNCCICTTNCIDQMNETCFIECVFICKDPDFELNFDKNPFLKMMHFQQFDNSIGELTEYLRLSRIHRATYTFENENKEVRQRFQSIHNVF